METILKRVWVCVAICLPLAAGFSWAEESFYDIPAPGQRIDLGGYKLHLDCAGNGSPTVILESGLGDWSSHWAAVQKLLKSDTRVCSYDRAGYGWSDPAPYQTMSRIDYPNSENVAAEPLYVSGISFSGERGIKRVEVSTDGGKTWADAQLRPPTGAHTWVLWTYPWKPEPGTYTLQARATDGAGQTQTADVNGTYPDGATGYHTRRVRVG